LNTLDLNSPPKRIVIFANGELADLDRIRLLLRDTDYIICADGGSRHAFQLNIRPDLVIGDMDSVDADLLQIIKNLNVPIQMHPRDKNETDLELALTKAIEHKPLEIVVLAALGGRIDQTLANIALLAEPQLSTTRVKIDNGTEEIFICRDQVEINGRSGDIISLIPWGSDTLVAQTENLKWKLNNEILYMNKTRGVSNELTGSVAKIKISKGLILVVHTRKSE